MNNVKMESSNLRIFLRLEFIEMTLDLKGKTIHTYNETGY